MENNYTEDFRLLNNSMLNNELVVFVGAGVSMGSGLLSWNGLIKELQDRLGITDNYNDNTIIPQLYYNSRGKKEYNELIQSLLYNPNTIPNPIHECLVKINPRYIITTNYDNLIEKAFSANGIFLNVVEKDSDLPYAHTDHILIKMHGGFKYNNYVLKEDDYLNYTKNFTLIENYVKALFARYTVLFVGYSFNDPDTKQIVAWIRNILKEDQQRAYLINISDDYNVQTYEYYKNIGINVIYAKSIVEQSEDLTHNTVSVLNRIIVPEYNSLSMINNILKRYNDFNFIPGGYIQSVFNSYYNCYLDNDCLIFNCENEEEYLSASLYFDRTNEETNKNIQNQYPFIIKILEKSSISKIEFVKIYDFLGKGKRIDYDVPHTNNLPDINPYETFDYIFIKNHTMPLLNNSDDNYLQKSYCFYYLKEYLSCYDHLRKASEYYLSTNQLELYLITETNRINVGRVLLNPFVIISPEKRAIIRNEIDKIETQNVYLNNYRTIKDNDLICELINFKYIYNNLYSIIDKGRKVDKEARTQYSSYCGITAYERIEYIAQNLYKYIQYNYLMLDVYSETKCIYTVLIDYLFLSLSKKGETTTLNPMESTYNVTLEELSKFDVMVILRFISYNDIKEIILKWNIRKIDFNAEVVEYLLSVITNLNNALKSNISGIDIDIYNKLFYILKMSNIPDNLFDAIYETMKLLSSKYYSNIDYKEIHSFIGRQYNVENKSFEVDKLEELIKSICFTSLHNKQANSDQNYNRMISNLVGILHEIEPNKKIEIDDDNATVFSICLSETNLIYLYSVANDYFQKRIQDRIIASLSKKFDTDIYYHALMTDVIQPNEDLENSLYKIAESSVVKTDTIITIGNNCLSDCVALIIENKIINKSRFEEIVKQDNSLYPIIDPDNFNFDLFDPQSLLTLTYTALKKLSDNETSYRSIHEKLKHLLSDHWDERMAKIYIEFFS